MLKTKKSIAKKFKVTGTGKDLLRKPGFRHFLSHKTPSQSRRASKDIHLGNARQANVVRKAMALL